MHYVFLTSEYNPLPSANGLCVDALVQELVDRGHIVDVICNGSNKEFSNDIANPRIHRVGYRKADDSFGRKANASKLGLKMETLWNLPYYPVRSRDRVKQYLSLFRQIYAVSKVNCVIASQKPMETTSAGALIKKEFLDVKFLIYELDSISHDLEAKQGWKRYFSKASKKAETKYFDSADGILHLECNRTYYTIYDYERYAKKTKYVDIPLISKNQYGAMAAIDVKEESSLTKFIYTGVLARSFRDPSYLIQLLQLFGKGRPTVVDFFSRGNCEKLIREAEQKTDGMIRKKGYVSPVELNRYMASADFMINIGNMYSGENHAISSKIFSYMLTGKPIIHILGNRKESCLDYLKHYPFVLILDSTVGLEENCMRLSDFVDETKGERVPYETILAEFIKNTPEYSVDVIESFN